MKIIISIFTVFALQACSSVPDQEPQPSHIEQVTLPDGRVVDNYVFGYGIEHFLCEFNTGKDCYKH